MILSLAALLIGFAFGFLVGVFATYQWIEDAWPGISEELIRRHDENQ